MALSNPLHTLLRRSEFWSQHLSHFPARRPLKFYGVGTGLILAVGGASSCTWRRTETTFLMSGDWIYEIKFDGYRALALRGGSEARVLSRNQKDLGSKFPEVKDSIAALNIQDAIIDGEIVALDEKGRSSDPSDAPERQFVDFCALRALFDLSWDCTLGVALTANRERRARLRVNDGDHLPGKTAKKLVIGLIPVCRQLT
jgi:hypothetical protein